MAKYVGYKRPKNTKKAMKNRAKAEKRVKEKMANENHEDYTKALISFEKGINDKDALDKLYTDYMENDSMTLLNDEFDYMICFENDPEDTYRYCFKDEGCHIIYHRFLPEDYEEFRFGK